MMKPFVLLPLLAILLLMLTSCGAVATPIATQAPATQAPTIEPPTTPTYPAPATPTYPAPTHVATAATISVGDQLAQIDDILRQSIKASIAHNEPQSMLLGETTTIELLLNPSLSPEALSTQVTAPGPVASASVQITPRMKALLLADDSSAFTIQPLYDNPEQLISGTETTQWTWRVTSLKSGTQRLTLVLYRLVQFDGVDYWREIESYRADINVQVTVAQRIGSLDWKWFVGILLTAILIPAFWRWMDYRKNKSNPKKPDAKKKSA
jgi:hypothetical protein